MSKKVNIFVRIWRTIKKFLHLGVMKAEQSIPIEDQLKMQKEELLAKRDRILNGDTLARVRGAKRQADDELTRLIKERAKNGYEKKIRELMKVGNREQAKRLLIKKKAEDEAIERVKQKSKEFKESDEKISKSLDILDEKITEITNKLNDLVERNRDAEQRNEIFGLMNELNDIDMSVDMDSINAQIRNNEQEAYGREEEFSRRSAGQIAEHEASMANLDDELNQFL